MENEGNHVTLQYIQRDIEEIKNRLRGDFVQKDEFNPVRNIVYGMVATILLGVLGAIITLVLRQ